MCSLAGSRWSDYSEGFLGFLMKQADFRTTANCLCHNRCAGVLVIPKLESAIDAVLEVYEDGHSRLIIDEEDEFYWTEEYKNKDFFLYNSVVELVLGVF